MQKKIVFHVGLNSVNKIHALYIEMLRTLKKMTTMDCQFVSLCDGDSLTVACHLFHSATCCCVGTQTHFAFITYSKVTLLCKSGGKGVPSKDAGGARKNLKYLVNKSN